MMDEKQALSESDGTKKNPASTFLETAAIARGGDTCPSPDRGTSAAAWVGRALGKYRITGILGQGGMGTVFRAHDPLIDRDVAIKLLPEELAEDATALARFLSEARAAGSLNHPNVVAIYEIGQEGRNYYLALELMPGGSVADRLDAQHPYSLLDATRIAIDACKALSAAHAVGLVHRDIKPANLMRAADGTAKLIDFGLAKTTTDRAREVTQAGMVVGTPYFMSPEQCDAKPVDARSDIYSLGATYFSLLTGANPYQDSIGVIQVMFGHCQGAIPDPRALNSSIPTACSAIVARTMAKAPADRYQSASELMADLQAVSATLSGAVRIELPSQSGVRPAAGGSRSPESSHPMRRDRRIWIAASAAAAIVIGLAIYRPWQPPVQDRAANPATGNDQDGATGVASAGSTRAIVPKSSGADGSSVQGITAREIVLGMSAPFNGPSRELGRQMQVGLNACFSEVNERGGIRGRRIRLVALDDGYEPSRALENMKELYGKHKVFAVIGNVGTPTAEKTLPFALDHQFLFFGAFSGAKLLRKDPPDRFVFNYRASYEEEAGAILKYLVEVKKIRTNQVAVFAQQDGYGDTGFNGVVKMLRKLGGDPDRLLRVGYVRNTADVAAAADTIIRTADLRAVIMVPTYRPAARFIQLVKDAGKDLVFANVSFVGGVPLADELIQLGPKYCDGVIVTEVVPDPQSRASAILKYRAALAKYAPNEKPTSISLEAYIDASIFVRGLERVAANPTTDSLITALESIHDLDLGLGAPISFGPSQHQASHKVWAAILDKEGHYRALDLD